MNKTEIIENLYKAGKITFEEAVTLSGNSNKIESALGEGAVASPTQLQEKTLNNFLDEIVEELYDDELPDENLAFNSKKCVDAMNANNWAWRGQKTMTEDVFKQQLRKDVTRTIEEVIKKYKTDPTDNECYWSQECGGIRVSGWLEPDENGKNMLIIRPEFILEDVEAVLDNDKFKNLL